MGGGNGSRKGVDLLKVSFLCLVNNTHLKCERVVFGQPKPEIQPYLGLLLQFIRHL